MSSTQEHSVFRLGCLCAALAVVSAQAATNTLPSSAALPLGSASSRGFVVRTVQAPATPALLNNSIRALRQINGSLKDDRRQPRRQ